MQNFDIFYFFCLLLIGAQLTFSTLFAAKTGAKFAIGTASAAVHALAFICYGDKVFCLFNSYDSPLYGYRNAMIMLYMMCLGGPILFHAKWVRKGISIFE